MIGSFKALALAGAALTLGACANSSLMVEQPYAGDQRFAMAQIVQADSTVDVDEDNSSYTARKLEEALFGGDTPLFTRGEGVDVRWRYVTFNEGSRAGRYLTGGLAGGSKIVLEVEFVDQSGTVLSTVRGEGSVSGGIGGGSNKTGIDKAVEKVVDYAGEKFAQQ